MKPVRIFGLEPAAILYAVNAAVALLVSYGLDLTRDQVSAVTVIVTGVLAAAVAALTRPVVVSTITGAAATVLTAMAAFGFELTADQIGATVTALSIVLALLLRQNVSPTPVTTRA
ncbi:hypothetical protein [Actinomadura sp. HBU206391]|uniref:hypothetical protein n=1 Tax=Actinomadura sp. HBU206391 TaxID=2731692 RepID=UPI00164F12E1|nr:hypothetical protein [Actinomadura sp. HBU206391]MBC6458437.1 hypothetical protein [Actinomadura sp. HBU206391]